MTKKPIANKDIDVQLLNGKTTGTAFVDQPKPTKPVIDLFLIRHGESVANTTREFIGGRATKSPLSSLGVQQAITLGRSLSTFRIHFDKVYSSTATRAIQTASLVMEQASNVSSFDIDSYKELEELDQGKWEGQIREEIYTPEVLANIKCNLLDSKAPKGESQREVGERIDKFIRKKILNNPTPFTAGIFFHGLAIKCWLQKIMDFDPKIIFPMEISNCSITRVQYNCKEKLWCIKCINYSGKALR